MAHFEIIRPTAKSAIKMWHHQYGFASQLLADGSNSGEISKQLRALKRPTKKQVEKIIGALYGGWTTVFCSICHEYAPEAASFDNGDSSIEVCKTCLQRALKRLR